MINIKLKKTKYQFGTYWAGPIFLLLGISYLITEQVYHWNHYAYLFLGVSTTLFLIFDKQANYITIYDDRLVINGLWTCRLYLKDITSFQVNGDYLKIFSNTREINVNLSLVTEASKTELIFFLENLRLTK